MRLVAFRKRLYKSYKYEEVFMEKNENEELLEQSPAAIQQEDTQKIAKSGKRIILKMPNCF